MDTFKDGIQPLRLPYSSTTRKATLTANCTQVSIRKELVLTMDSYAQANNMSRFAVLLSILHGTLYLHNQQESLTTGIETANRSFPDSESISGQLINTLLVQSKVLPITTLKNLTAQVSQQLINGLDFEFYPFEEIARAFSNHQIPYPFPLFNALVIYQNFTDILDSCEIGKDKQPVMIRADKTITDIVFEFTDIQNEVELVVQYDNGLFTSEEISLFCNYFLKLGEKWLANPALPLNQLELNDDQEISRQLSMSKGPIMTPTKKTISELITIACSKHTNKRAIVCGNNELTYDQLNDAINRMSYYLISTCKIRPSNHVPVIGQVNEKATYKINIVSG